jgi:hypothetical protein
MFMRMGMDPCHVMYKGQGFPARMHTQVCLGARVWRGEGKRPEEAGHKQHLLMAVRHMSGQQLCRCPSKPL